MPTHFFKKKQAPKINKRKRTNNILKMKNNQQNYRNHQTFLNTITT